MDAMNLPQAALDDEAALESPLEALGYSASSIKAAFKKLNTYNAAAQGIRYGF
jgi:hypothetical protein